MRYMMLLLMLAGAADAGEFGVTLKTAEEAALATSNQYRAALSAAEAARSAAGAASSALYPRVALEGSVKYNEVVPRITVGPLSRALGDNWNYTVGPSAYYTLFDGGAQRGAYEAARKAAAARQAEAEQARRQAVLKARGAYFRMQLALEKVYLIGENLQLALSQQKDMELGVKAGSRSRLDGIRARQEVTARRRDLLLARSELSAALRELSFASGLEFKGDISLPLDARMEGRTYAGAEGGVYIKADSYEEILARLRPAAEKPPDPSLPAAAALENTAEFYRLFSRAYKAELLPRLNLGARSSIDYPDGPNLYSFLQNSASLSLSLPLFENGRSAERQREGELNRAAALERRTEALRAARRDFDQARDAYGALLAEQSLNIEAVDDADTAARLSYEAYQAGGATWLEVESANLKVLQARTTAAITNSEILLRLAQLDSLSAQ